MAPYPRLRLTAIVIVIICLFLIVRLHVSQLISTFNRISRERNTKFGNKSHSATAGSCPPEFKAYLTRFRKYDDIRQEGKKPPADDRTDYSILILTPVADVAKSLHRYFALLCSLTYPHEKISVALGEDSSRDGTFHLANVLADQVRPYFGSVTVYKLTRRTGDIFAPEQKHDRWRQLSRRRHLAKARNHLLMNAIREYHDWVLWLDSDLAYYPPDLVQLLLSPAKQIVAPICLWPQPSSSVFSVYDKNTWRETNRSLDFVAKRRQQDANFLMLEGYSPSRRLYLSELRREGTVVPIDGVGGCTLLINATCHRSGLVFPPFVFDSHIETEALAKMATKMSIKIYGLPFVSVIHE